MEQKLKIKFNRLDVSYLPLLVTACITTFIVYIVYSQTQSILKERLRERLISIAATASLQISPTDIQKMQSENSVDSPELKKTINILRQIRDKNKDVKYIYIWGKTDNLNEVAFTADAEMLDPIDRDGNGEIDGIEIPPEPGEPYDISDIPEARDAFVAPTAANEFLIDKWGIFLSGFAPIIDENGNTLAILGIDVEVSDYYRLVRATFVPFVTLTILLLFFLTIQTVSLIRIWKNRVNLVKDLDRQKDELLSIVSHQLATPISSVRWYLEMLQDGDLGKITKEQSSHIESVQGIVVNLVDLVHMILDVSRIQLGKMRVEKQELDLSNFFHEVLSVITPKAKEKNINFNVNLPKTFPKAMLDKRLTRMTFENLLSNAIKYTPNNGTVEFKIEVTGETIHVKIVDSGCGIPQSEQGKIFGKLFRASNVRNNVDGNGFGLYVAKGAIENQGGKIWFTSEEGLGTTFYLDLPIK